MCVPVMNRTVGRCHTGVCLSISAVGCRSAARHTYVRAYVRTLSRRGVVAAAGNDAGETTAGDVVDIDTLVWRAAAFGACVVTAQSATYTRLHPGVITDLTEVSIPGSDENYYAATH